MPSCRRGITDRMTHLLIERLRVSTRIGATDVERATPQVVLIDVDIDAGLETAERSDELTETIDYDALTTDLASFVEGAECRLLEHLAAQIADRISKDARVSRVTVEVAKEVPPVEQEVGRIAVRVERTR